MPTLDLTGGYEPAFDFPIAQPEDPEMRESVSMWISDDQGRFGLPRFVIEAVAEEWNYRGIEANIAFPGGRVLIGAGGFRPDTPKRVEGQIVTLNAGPLTFEIVEPLRRWKMRFDGSAYESTVARQIEGVVGGTDRRVRISIDAIMACPPWTPGEQAAQQGDTSTALAVGAVGGHRHEQLFRCSGRVEIEGDDAIDFSGTGLRIRRTGVRNVGAFPGHCWQSALFPSGKAFGILAFPPRSDGTAAYSEAFLFDGEKKTYGKVIEAPWMTSIIPHGGPVGLVIETEAGLTRIDGITHDTTFIAKDKPMFGDWAPGGIVSGMALPFHQGGALYTWDGEEAYGMIERSLPVEQMTG
ncbi:hypothetical protein D3Y57_04545 (plasmid) [Sphingomonas paeninsulae]|uniref:6-phosphofructokinase n=1 Tax=Sphingomonas paeninsulae TaxID=2319844 RepID=A0A494TDC2_SPHPE|nr:hypothetical protein [Sphingomonas paeninsulae]AYJ85292.1 hypothetical protein D3Y57_04545 [Sphingomonas paeninsulae]